jgi:hypothetical protein
MRSLQIQAALTEHVEAIASQLHDEIANGAEVSFELEQQGRSRASSGVALFCYRPLTAQFIQERLSTLERSSAPAWSACACHPALA